MKTEGKCVIGFRAEGPREKITRSGKAFIIPAVESLPARVAADFCFRNNPAAHR